MSFEANPLIDLPVEGNMGEKLCLDGEAFAAQDDFEQADASFRDALDRDGTNPRALAGRSRCLRELCEYERAQRVLDRGLFLYPVDQRLLAEQGKLYFDQEEWDKALATFNQALDLTPTPDSWEWIIKCLCHKGPPFEEAEKAASQALSQFPTSSGVLTQRAWLFVSQKKYGAAVEAFLQAGARESLESVLKEGFVFEWRAPIGFIEAVVDRLPKDVAILARCGQLFHRQRRYARAVEIFDQILSLEPSNVKAVQYKLRSLRGQHRYEEADSTIAKWLEEFPGNAEVMTELAQLRIEQKKYNQAVEALIFAGGEKAVENELGPRKINRRIEPLVDAALDRLPKNLFILNLRASMFFDRHRYDKAVDVFDQMLSVQENHIGALRGKISCLRAQGLHTEAQRVLDEGMRRLPENVELLTERALLLCDEKQFDGAVDFFLQAGDEDALRTKVDELREERRFAECESLIEATLKRVTDVAPLLNQLGQLYLDQKRYLEAGDTFDRALAQDSQNEETVRLKCYSLRLQKRFAEAKEAIRDALSRWPDSVDLLNELGWGYFDDNRYDSAKEAFERILAVDEKNTSALEWKIRSLLESRSSLEGEKLAAIDKQVDNSLNLLQVQDEDLQLRMRGFVHLKRGDFPKAYECFSKAIEESPEDIDLYFNTADTLEKLNRSKDALSLLQGLKQSRPDNLDVSERLGWVYLNRNDLIHAKEEFEFILKKDSGSILGINGLGGAYFEQEQYVEAEGQFRQALRLAPNEVVYWTNLAQALVRQIQAGLRVPSTERHPFISLNRIRLGGAKVTAQSQDIAENCLREAEDCCKRALELKPEHAPAFGCLGVIDYKRGKLLESEEHLKRAIVLGESGYHVDLAALYMEMGRYDDAEECLKKSCAIDQNDWRARLQMGNLYLETDRAKESVRMFREAIAIDPKSEEAHCQLALALKRKEEFSEAENVLRKALRGLDQSRLWRLHLALAELLGDLGEKSDDPRLREEALGEAKTAIVLKPSHPQPYFRAGMLRFKLEDYRGALKDFQACLERDPDHPDAERNVLRLKLHIRRESVREKGVWYGRLVMVATCVAILVILWASFWTGKVKETTLITLTPILLGLIPVGFLLPLLTKLKLLGVEAELSQTQEKISKGPTGDFGK